MQKFSIFRVYKGILFFIVCVGILFCSSNSPRRDISVGKFRSFQDYQDFYQCEEIEDDTSEFIASYYDFPPLGQEWNGADFQNAANSLNQISEFNYPRHCSNRTGLIFERFITWDNFKSYNSPNSRTIKQFHDLYKGFFVLFQKYAEANQTNGMYERELYFMLPTSLELMNRLVNLTLQQSNSLSPYHPNFRGFQATQQKTIGDLNFLINNALDLVRNSNESEHDQMIVSNRMLMSFFGMIYFVNGHNRIKGNQIFSQLEKNSKNWSLISTYNKLARLFYSR